MLLIRRFESKDAVAVSSLSRETIKVSNSGDYALERLQLLMDYFSPEKVLLLNLERDCLVAEVDNRVVGTVAIEGDELLTFFVHPDFQVTGIGTELLRESESIALADGVRSLKCEASITAVPFYQRRDYWPTGTESNGIAGKQKYGEGVGLITRVLR